MRAFTQSAGAASPQLGVPASEIGAIQSQLLILGQRINEVCSNQDAIEQRLIPVSLPYPVSTGPSGTELPDKARCDVELSILSANHILSILAERQLQTMKHLQV